PKPERRTVFLSVEEHRESKEVTAPAWGRAVAIFQHRFARAGSYPVTAQLNEDRYPGDDTRWAVPEVRDTLRVGLLAREPATAEVWRRALEAVGWARVEQLAAADLAATSAFDAVLLAGDGGDALRTLRGTLGAGSTVIWYPGTNLDAAVLSEAFGAAPQPAPLWRAGTKPHSLRLAAEGDPVFRIFSGGEYGNPAAGAVYARLDLSPLAVPPATVLMAYEDGVPALARSNRGGVLFLWNLPLGRGESDIGGRMEFVPLLGEMILASRTGGGDPGREGTPGGRLAWPADLAADGRVLKLLGPDGQEPGLAASPSATGGLTSDPIAEPGLYRWESEGRLLRHEAVNFPAVESDLRAVDVAPSGDGRELRVKSGAMVKHLREGVPLWPRLLGAGMLLVLLEGLMLLWAERT
ncbi:MAG: hypothetical protein KJ579_11340, partial [Verrucomicrobia bacterium]|nr:hypothetical protein [Verrucomicrobiota bacterium]